MTIKKIYGMMACDPDGVIGKDGKLPWNYPEDIAHFEETTRHHVIVMGYKTFLTLPEKYFDKRMAIVFSHHSHEEVIHPNIKFVSSLAEFLSLDFNASPIYMIGGAELFVLFLKHQLMEKIILTKLKSRHPGDVFIPLELISEWKTQKVRETADFCIDHYFYPGAL